MLEVSSFAELCDQVAVVVGELYVDELEDVGMVELLDDVQLVVEELKVGRTH